MNASNQQLIENKPACKRRPQAFSLGNRFSKEWAHFVDKFWTLIIHSQMGTTKYK